MRPADGTTARRAALGNMLLLGGFALLSALLLLWQASELQWRDPGSERWLTAALATAAWLGLSGLLRFRRRAGPRKPIAVMDVAAGQPAAFDDGEIHAPRARPADAALRVVYASQTGFAEQLARQTLQSLRLAGLPARVDGIDRLTLDELRQAGRVLFVVSTTGDGEPPDMALAFSRLVMQRPAALANLCYGLLALGDSDYEDFCGFGRQLQRWLQASGAQALFDPVEVDSEDEASLRHWQNHLAMLSGARDLPDWQTPKYQRWQLVERRLLNPGSVGEPCFHLALKPLAGHADWRAGDLVEVGPCHAPERVAAWLAAHGLDGRVPVSFEHKKKQPLADLLACCRLPEADEVDGLDEDAVAAMLQRLPHREYSIASLPDDGTLQLLVRRMRARGGYPGLGSGWLTEHAAVGTEIALRVRSNVNFHAPRDARPLILIGNGTGLAALRALLKQRIAAGHRRNWLLFGERHKAHDFLHREEIERWVAEGGIERVDFAWSRDQAERIHVQQRLREAADVLRDWVDAGAAIYVCGSLDGLAPGVDAVLHDVLGAERVARLRERGCYRRDVY
ncbi:MAG TPA: sulfite reductase flavoprotein subunit alpha [Rhodanobacter sp.]|nr:sulfite reductase flavoprotein subunit alpha [Rhodanobacter sp.]